MLIKGQAAQFNEFGLCPERSTLRLVAYGDLWLPRSGTIIEALG